MEKNSIKQLLMTSNFFVLNKQLVKNLGIETAFFLTALVEADEILADDDGWFYQTASTLEEVTGLSNHKQTKCIEQLISLGILLQENKGMPMKRYFKLKYEQVLKFLNASFEKNSNQDLKNFESKNSKNLKPSFQKNLNNKELNINNLDKEITTTKDNIDYIDPNSNEDFESSSSLKNNLNEIKKYLLEKIQDIPTCKNIYSIIEKNNISIEKLKQVINYADENKKGYGFIVKALEENWSLKTNETSKEIKKCPRGHNYNEHAINETRQAKEENEKYSQKIKYLDQLYNSLSASEKKKIDEEAYRKSVTLYGKFVAEKMANMKVKYEILEERIGYEGI